MSILFGSDVNIQLANTSFNCNTTSSMSVALFTATDKGTYHFTGTLTATTQNSGFGFGFLINGTYKDLRTTDYTTGPLDVNLDFTADVGDIITLSASGIGTGSNLAVTEDVKKPREIYVGEGTLVVNGSQQEQRGNVKEVYVGTTKVWPELYEISYDLRGGNISDLQAAGFDGIWTSGGYTFTSDGLQQTSSSNDRVVYVIKRGLDLTNAKKLIAYHVGQWQYASWSNGKDIKLCTDIITSSNDISLTNPRWDTYFTYSNNSSYRNSELPYVNASGTSTALARGIATSASGEDTITLTIDFENKTIEWKVAGTNNYTLSANLTDEQYNATKNMTAIYWGRGRGYHTYDSYERLKEIYLKIEY